jgi:hypothetical protein
VIAHEKTDALLDEVLDVVSPTIYPRSMRQFGTHLPPTKVPNAGIGPRLDFVEGRNRIALLRPTRSFADALDLEIAGVRLQLRHAPGETEDQILVWLPETRVLLAADNFYRSFPNLYAIRGTPYRDVRRWIASLDAMRALRPAHLVPSHTRPVSGEDAVMRALTDYRDAIQYVHDQTIRWMNAGTSPRARTSPSTTGASTGACARSSPGRSAGSTATRRGSSRCRPPSARSGCRRSPAAAARSRRRRSARSAPATCSGPRRWPRPRCGSRRTTGRPRRPRRARSRRSASARAARTRATTC